MNLSESRVIADFYLETRLQLLEEKWNRFEVSKCSEFEIDNFISIDEREEYENIKEILRTISDDMWNNGVNFVREDYIDKYLENYCKHFVIGFVDLPKWFIINWKETRQEFLKGAVKVTLYYNTYYAVPA